jgi:hypothetical protein
MFKVFGRVTGTQEECLKVLEFFEPNPVLVCFESADDGCSRDHCHFVAESSNYRSMKSLRESLSKKCFKVLEEKLRYSIKEIEVDKDAEAYICKGNKKDKSVKPTIIKNTLNVDIDEAHERYHRVASVVKNYKQTTCVWKEVIKYIEEVNPTLFSSRFTNGTQVRVASHLYDWYIKNEKMIQGKYVQQMVIQTIIAQKFNSKSLKRTIIEAWTSDITYFNGMDMGYDKDAESAFEDL